MKKRTVAGVLIAGGILIGTFLSGLFKDFGLGGGSGLGVRVSTESGTPAPQGVRAPEPEPERSSSPDDPEPEAVPVSAPGPAEVVHVLIDEHEYFLRRSADSEPAQYDAITLAQIVEMAADATGNDEGVRVRISRRTTARTTAELRLQEELRSAGVPDDAVRWESGLAP